MSLSEFGVCIGMRGGHEGHGTESGFPSASGGLLSTRPPLQEQGGLRDPPGEGKNPLPVKTEASFSDVLFSLLLRVTRKTSVWHKSVS